MRLILLFFCVTTAQSASAFITKGIPCDKLAHKGCLVWDNTTQDCYSEDCWKWDTINQKCVGQKDFIGPIVLQSIPITGMFGSGFGNMGRWDIFGTYQAVFWGPLVLLCCFMCCVISKDSTNEDTSGTTLETAKTCSGCFGCCWAIAVIALWIWGIVVIAEKSVKAPWVNANGTTVMCELYTP